VVRLTLERDGGAVLQEMPRTSDNNNNNNKKNSISSDAGSAANDSCSMLADLSVAGNAADSDSGPASPTSANMHRQVRRRSTVPKGFVAVHISFSVCYC